MTALVAAGLASRLLAAEFAPPEPSAAGALVYEAEAGCPDEAAFRAALAAPRSPDPAGAAGYALRLHRLSETRWRGELRVGGADAQVARQFEGESCAAVAEALALALALTVSPTVDEAAQAPRERGTKPAPPAAAFEVTTGLRTGLGPAAAPSVAAGLAARRRLWLARLGVEAARGASFARAGAAVRFDLLTAQPSLCARLALGARWELAAPCIGLELGVVRADAAGPAGADDAGAAVRAWLAAAAGAELRLALGARWSLGLSLRGLAPITRHRYVLDEPRRTLTRPPAFAAAAQLGVHVSF